MIKSILEISEDAIPSMMLPLELVALFCTE